MGTHRLTRVAGPAVTKELILLAENFRAQRALELGIVHRVVEPEGLDVAVANLAAKFRKLPPRTVGMAKRIIDEGSYLSLREGQNLEVEAQTTLLNSRDLLEAIDSFFENRAPEYVGE
jgi:enoyl-CoA hydratase/carnithine racemase